jgi:hypothetical protein
MWTTRGEKRERERGRTRGIARQDRITTHSPLVSSFFPPFLSRKAKLERLKRRGKVAPKKGEGRRAGKKK